MDKLMPNMGFRMMSLFLKFRDIFRPRAEILQEIEIKPGFNILDFGCGPGSYTLLAAKTVGDKGKVYALDIHPLAGKKIRKAASKLGLSNIETICSDCDTNLPDESMDIIFLYDIFHFFKDPNKILTELHRVLKPKGILSLSDHHMQEEEIIKKMEISKLFTLNKKLKFIYSFLKK